MEGEREKRAGRGERAAKCHPNFLTSEVGIMEGRGEATLRGDGLDGGSGGGQDDREPAMIASHHGWLFHTPMITTALSPQTPTLPSRSGTH